MKGRIDRVPQEQRKNESQEMLQDAEWPRIWFLQKPLVEKIMMDKAKKRVVLWERDLTNKNVWIWGEPGIGKGRWPMWQAPLYAMLKKNYNKRWCTYHIMTTKAVIIEDWPALPHGDCLINYLKI
jgi:hypothetical protein